MKSSSESGSPQALCPCECFIDPVMSQLQDSQCCMRYFSKSPEA